MDIAKFFDQTITDCDSGLAVRTIAVPSSSLAPHARAALFEWEGMLGLENVASLVSQREAIGALASLLGPSEDADEIAFLVATDSIAVEDPAAGITLASLADAPVEDGQLRLVAFDSDTLLLGAGRSGVVLCGPAESISRALQQGLSGKLRELMGLDGRKYESTGPASLARG